MLRDEQLAAIKARRAAATKIDKGKGTTLEIRNPAGGKLRVDFKPRFDVVSYGEFLFNAPADIDALLATVAQQRAIIEALRAALGDLADTVDDAMTTNALAINAAMQAARDALAAVAAMETKGGE